MSEFKNEIYASKVINDQPENFTGLEVTGVRYTGKMTDDDEKEVIVDNANPEFFSCYLRHKDGRALSCADFGNAAEAVAYGQRLADTHSWTFENKLPA
ncbi:hypothetical protein [Ralstonia phage RP31]|uniref:Uncharacterized protein n=1 Tax=Ralstonia phage RP31 TaxID=1923890 RepID=A0A1L7N250_9CAUD|nr:hypothetical protein [Ralstonia phage RP31]